MTRNHDVIAADRRSFRCQFLLDARGLIRSARIPGQDGGETGDESSPLPTSNQSHRGAALKTDKTRGAQQVVCRTSSETGGERSRRGAVVRGRFLFGPPSYAATGLASRFATQRRG